MSKFLSELDKLWAWYGKKRGLLDLNKGCCHIHGELGSTKYGIVWTGIVPEGAATIYMNTSGRSPIAWNRHLSFAEIDELEKSWLTFGKDLSHSFGTTAKN